MIEARGLSFGYRNADRLALDRLDLDLPAGQWGLLLGATGAGKSTFVRCLNRSIPQFFPGTLEGCLAIAGRDLAGRRVPEMSRDVGVVFQDFETQIFSTSCLLEVAFAMENRRLPPDRIRARAEELLERVGLAGFGQRDPATLSGGEKQRLVIAAVLALEAPLLVLDEPASDLDPGGRSQVYQVVASLAGRSVLLVEHDLEGLPPTGPATLVEAGRAVARWSSAEATDMVPRVSRLRDAGVRPPPLAALADACGLSAGPGVLTPEALHAAFDREGWTFEAPALPEATPVSGPEIVRVENLSCIYPGPSGGRRALDAVSLAVREGEMLAVIGANGSGKTTLALHLNGLMSPTGGRVLYRGEDVRSMPARRRAREIGFVFQNPDHQIFAATVGEEVAFGPRNIGLPEEQARERVESALYVVGLSGTGDRDPFTLTKGERQRLALASVLACEPSLIIMDEPTTGLDLRQQASVMELLERLRERGHTIVIITHALWLLRSAVRRAVVMIDGRVAADGAPRDLLTDEGLMTRAGLRMPDLARLARLRGAALLTQEEWVAALRPPSRAGGG